MTSEMLLSEIYELPEFIKVKRYLIGGGAEFFEGEKKNLSLKNLQKVQPTWNSEDILFGLKRLKKVAEDEQDYVYHVYPEGERRKNPELEDAVLIYLPAEKKKTDKCVILLAGGGYGCVCTMVEALPVAARFNELGFTCFCLNYRIASQVDLEEGLMPKPLDDLAAAWKFLKSNQKRFGINAEQYIVGGFSAGGHATAMWGTEKKGYLSYGIPKPELLLLAYPLISFKTIGANIRNIMCNGLFGKNNSKDVQEEYDVSCQVSASYPQTYLIQSIDDDTVPIINAELMEKAMKEYGIYYKIDRIPTGGHGFGLGSATPGAGWIEQALQKFYGESENEDI